MKNILDVKDLCKTYVTDKRQNNVLKNVSFTVKEGEMVAIMGPSGSGKSTLLYAVSGMDKPTSGTVMFDDKEISAMSEKEMADIRLNDMGFIFQQMYMMKKLCVLDNIILPGYQAKRDRAQVNKRADELMESLGIKDLANRQISEVSGGQLQRACICRALINEPKVVFADEPTGALNSKAAGEVMKELRKVNLSGTGIMMVTHSVRVAAQSDRVIYLVDSNIMGEIILGRMQSDEEIATRDQKLNSWLMEQGW